MKGRRVPWPEEAIPVEIEKILEPGDYAGPWRGMWLLRAPNGASGALKSPPHQITVNADGTLTVQPSILIYASASTIGWHGYLEAGVWRQC